MRTRKYFVDEAGRLYPAIKGVHGYYCYRPANYRGVFFSYSGEDMKRRGYEIRALTKEEVKAYQAKYKAFCEEMEASEKRMRLEAAAVVVAKCLASEPLEIGHGNQAWESITPITGGMADAYNGDGQGLAYILDNKIIAFHYGFEKPENAPKCHYIQIVEIMDNKIYF